MWDTRKHSVRSALGDRVRVGRSRLSSPGWTRCSPAERAPRRPLMTDVSAEDRTHRAERLKERIYLTFAALAVVLVMSGHNQSDPLVAILTLLVAALGTLLA